MQAIMHKSLQEEEAKMCIELKNESGLDFEMSK